MITNRPDAYIATYTDASGKRYLGYFFGDTLTVAGFIQYHYMIDGQEVTIWVHHEDLSGIC